MAAPGGWCAGRPPKMRGRGMSSASSRSSSGGAERGVRKGSQRGGSERVEISSGFMSSSSSSTYRYELIGLGHHLKRSLFLVSSRWLGPLVGGLKHPL
eukprot:580046-Prorocentrum_minimum.AAC.1